MGNHCKSDNTGAIVGIVLGVVFGVCCCVGVGVMLRKKRGRQTAQTVNKPQAPQLVQMTGTVQHNSVPNQTAYGNTMHNGSMRMHQNVMYQNGPRMSAAQHPMQQPYQQPMQQPYQQPMHNTCNLMVTISANYDESGNTCCCPSRCSACECAPKLVRKICSTSSHNQPSKAEDSKYLYRRMID